jgi:integrase
MPRWPKPAPRRERRGSASYACSRSGSAASIRRTKRRRAVCCRAYQRSRPHIYTDAEIGSIIAAAKALPSIYGLRGLTCSTLFGLIAVTGLRISEALALDRDDLDADHDVLRVRQGKLGKERLLPLDPSVVAQMIDYLAERDRLIGHPAKPLFVTDKTTRLTDCSARYNFARACQQMGFGLLSHTASMAGDRAYTIFATPSPCAR